MRSAQFEGEVCIRTLGTHFLLIDKNIQEHTDSFIRCA